jgi:hypothetical protein
MHKRAMVLAFLLATPGAAYAQQCLHGQGETPEQGERRREALTAARTINNIEANQPGARAGLYLRRDDLDSSPFAEQMRRSPNEFAKRLSLAPGKEILPGWELMLDVGDKSYWFMIRDKTDPCSFAYVSNHLGLIFSAEVTR